MKICSLLRLLVFAACFSCAPAWVNATQILNPDPTIFVEPGESFNFSPDYQIVTPTSASETGLAVRVHYDSSQLIPGDTLSLVNGMQPVGQIQEDTQNYDGDAQTDRYFILSWIDITAQWPGDGVFPLSLFNTRFEAVDSFKNVSPVRLSAIATARGTNFQSKDSLICPKPGVFLSATRGSIREGDVINSLFRFSLGSEVPAVCGGITLKYELSGSAVAGTDYKALSGEVVLPQGASFVDVPVSVLRDDQVENSEKLTLTLLRDSEQDYYVMGSGQSTVLINDYAVPVTNMPLSNGGNATGNVSGTLQTGFAHQIPTVGEWVFIAMNIGLALLALLRIQGVILWSWGVMVIGCSVLIRGVNAGEILLVPPEVFQPPVIAQRQFKKPEALKAPPVKSPALAFRSQRSNVVSLGKPSATELASLQNNQQKRGARAFQIGISRDLPNLPSLSQWNWSVTNEGGQAAHLTLKSEGAVRIRALLQLQAELPKGVEIRVYDPDDSRVIQGPFTAEQFVKEPQQSTAVFWTPALEGDNLAIEVFVPLGVPREPVLLNVINVSHILYDVRSSQFRNQSELRSSSCQLSIACEDSDKQSIGNAVARYIYTEQSGASYLCTGTLLADQDKQSQIPYFITAAHCINNQAAASSMNFFWLYREKSCGAGDTSFQITQGGAQLLSSETNLDATFLKLNEAPPAGVFLSGWALNTLEAGETVRSVHHANGAPQKYSEGLFASYIRVTWVPPGDFIPVIDPEGDFIQVNWSRGITASGSSGGGLWQEIAGNHYLKGTLVGGSSSCSLPSSPDQYTRLESFYPQISAWLGGSGPEKLSSFISDNNALTALGDGILLARYMQGVRGNELLEGLHANPYLDVSALEQSLSSAMEQLDIDADGKVQGQRDGLLLIRYLLGYRGAPLLEGIDLSGAQRSHYQIISEYIETLLDN